MGEFITTDIGHNPARPLQFQFDNAGARQANSNVTTGAAKQVFSQTDPNTLDAKQTARNNAFGITPTDGIITFIHDGSTAITFTAYIYNKKWGEIASKPWVLAAESTALDSKLSLANALVSFKLPANCPYYIQAGAEAAAPTHCMVHDGGPDPANPNTNTDRK